MNSRETILYQYNPRPIVIYDIDTFEVLDVNEAFLEKYGYARAELSKLSVKDLRPREHVDDFRSYINGLDENPTQSDVWVHKRKDGSLFYTRVTSQSIDYENRSARLSIIDDITDLVKSRQKRQELSDKIEFHLNNSPLAMIEWDSHMNIRFWSNKAEEIFGLKAEQTIGRNIADLNLIYDEDREALEAMVESFRPGGNTRAYSEFRYRTQNGNIIYCDWFTSALVDDDGRVQSILSQIQDTTERHLTEEKLRSQNQFTEYIVKGLPGSLFVLDKQLNVIRWNENLKQESGYSDTEIVHLNPLDFFPPEHHQEIAHSLREVLDSGAATFETEILRKNQTRVPYLFSMVGFGTKDNYYFIGVGIDTSRQVEAEHRHLRELGFSDALINSFPGIMSVIDKNGYPLRWNKNFEERTGYSDAEIREMHCLDFFKSSDCEKISNKLREVLESGQFTMETDLMTKSGALVPYYIKAKRFKREGETFVVAMGLDMSKQRNDEAQILDALHEKELMLKEIHHRIKNNLAIISGLLELESFKTENIEVQRVLNDAQLRIHTIGLIHEKLYQNETLSQIDIDRYIKELAHSIDRTMNPGEKDIILQIHADNIKMGITQAIPCALIINELLVNAYKYAFKGNESGTISIDIHKKSDDFVSLSVADDGVGLPEQVHPGSTDSLGMSLIHSLGQQLSAITKIERNGGTRFTLNFRLDSPKH